MSIERVIAAQDASSVRLDMPAGRITVRVDPLAKAACVVLRTAEDEGEAADAVNAAEVRDKRAGLFSREGWLVVEVPEVSGQSSISSVTGGSVVSIASVGGNVVFQSGGTVVVGSGFDSRATARSSRQVRAEVVLPPGGGLQVKTASANVDLTGRIKAAQVRTVSGDVSAERVASLTVRTVSGSLVADHIEEGASVSTVSGSVAVARYTGSGAVFTTISGRVGVDVDDPACGRLTAATTSGGIRIRGGVGRVETDLRSVCGTVDES